MLRVLWLFVDYYNDTKERAPTLRKKYNTISLINRPCKIMLRIILKRRQSRTTTKRTSNFRPKRSTTEQLFNIRLLIEKHVDHHQDLYHNFIDFKKACDHVWHKGLWRVTRRYNIDEGLLTLLESQYGPSRNAVLQEGEIGQSFRTFNSEYVRDIFCRQCCSTYTLKIACNKLYTMSMARYRYR